MPSSHHPPFEPEWVRDKALALKDLEGPLLPILIAIQARFGAIDERAIPIVADCLNLSRAEVHGVVSFYHDFRRRPAGRHVVRLCRAEACQSMGSEALAKAVESRLGLATGETSRDGETTLEAVYCLGNCALSPAAEIDGALMGRATPERILAKLDGGRS